MGWLVGLWDGAHRWSIRNHFWSVIISFLIYQKQISEFSQHYFWNTINCNFAKLLRVAKRFQLFHCHIWVFFCEKTLLNLFKRGFQEKQSLCKTFWIWILSIGWSWIFWISSYLPSAISSCKCKNKWYLWDSQT